METSCYKHEKIEEVNGIAIGKRSITNIATLFCLLSLPSFFYRQAHIK